VVGLVVGSAVGMGTGCEREGDPTSPSDAVNAGEDSCSGAERWAAVWTDARRGGPGVALGSLPGQWPLVAAARIEARIEAGAEPWSAAYARACAAGDRSAQRCLDRQLWSAEALVDAVIEAPETRGAALWPEVGAMFRSAGDCLESPEGEALPESVVVGLARVRLSARLGEGERAAGELDRIRGAVSVELALDPGLRFELAVAELGVALGRRDAEAIAEAERVLDVLRSELDWGGGTDRPTMVRLAVWTARRSVDPLEAARQFDRLVERGSEGVADSEGEAAAWRAFERALARGGVLAQLGDFGAAADALSEAIAVAARYGGEDSPEGAAAQLALAEALAGRRRLTAVHDLLVQAREGFADSLGPDHPQTLEVMMATGQLFMAVDQPSDAHMAFLDLLEIHTQQHGPKDPRTAAVKVEIGDALRAMGEHRGARQMFAEALVPTTEALGPDHPRVVRILVHMGASEFVLGELEQAGLHCRTAGGLASVLGPDDPLRAEVDLCLKALAKIEKRRRR